jgi:hypothetical protein
MTTIPPKPLKLLSKICSPVDAGFLMWFKEQLEQKPGMEIKKRYTTPLRPT